AKAFFEENKWAILPGFKWDITDFGLGDFNEYGLTLINLAEEKEYCEKLMYAHKNQKTPAHLHKKKKEDIICRQGILSIKFWKEGAAPSDEGTLEVKVNGEFRNIPSGSVITLQPGERATILQGQWHEFWPETAECIISEVSTANDDVNDNFFFNENVGRFSQMEEDEAPLVKLVSD
ncbi:MAG TPA: D-lyxose/D-mannose family sugar isomerase, partial [Niabella sp.]|nr:D-lyxose/D-mannose family sugar isomerase [Niabella sp.]